MVLMGGAYRTSGNAAPTTNGTSPPSDAAKVVFTAFGGGDGIPRPVALGLDVTERAKFTPDHMTRLARRAGSQPDESLLVAEDVSPHGPEPRSVASNPIVRFVADALRFYMEFHSRFDGFYGAFIHDALALATALDPSLGRSESLTVEVPIDPRATGGPRGGS
jgi:purine nucleosidase